MFALHKHSVVTVLVLIVSTMMISNNNYKVNGQSPFRYPCNVCGNDDATINNPGQFFILYRILFIIPVSRNCGRHYYENKWRGARSRRACTRYQSNDNMKDICGCTKPTTR